MIDLFHDSSQACSKIVTHKYSTSFGIAIRLLHPRIRSAIYNIYGFVRLADEIVDSFHEYDKKQLLAECKAQTFKAIETGISLNPILHSFQLSVHQYNIDHSLIHAFFRSMEMDLEPQEYDRALYDQYIYGSAEVVGLMCLQVFCERDQHLYHQLQPGARALGAAFQKVNFLRDIQADYIGLHRTYFPGVDFNNFTEQMKREVEEDVSKDFESAYKAILALPASSRYAVLLAYKYYHSLFKKIKRSKPTVLLSSRIRVPDHTKLLLFLRTGLDYHTSRHRVLACNNSFHT